MVIVNYGLSNHIGRLLEEGVFGDCRVMLVDNASEPERLRDLAARFATQLLLLDRNYGFAGAVNRAVGRAGGCKQILLLNPDVSISRAQLQVLRTVLVEEQLTAASPILLNVDGKVQVGTAGGPLTWSAFGTYFLFVSHVFGRARGSFYTRRQLVSGMVPSWLCMACLLLDGDAFRRFGPIPEDEVVYGEDLAWGYRASRSGARFRVVTHVQVVHEQGAAGASDRSVDALVRLVRRVNGRLGGSVAVACIRLGLAIRRLPRWLVTGQRL
ncbi:MAG TPA: glycosyltransferase [Acidimicrobiales bacterium]|nr:glycosyltransferase [Acidimicrobiales bacterium]